MYYWRISKYNPRYRENNVYQNHEWTSIHDIGNKFNGEEFTLNAYVDCEEQYINAVIWAMKELNIISLKLDGVEKYGYDRDCGLAETSAEEFYNSLKDDMVIQANDIEIIMKLMLREMIWGKLSSENLYIHFGYDYYMYIGSSKELKETQKYIESSSIFIESMKSPYIV